MEMQKYEDENVFIPYNEVYKPYFNDIGVDRQCFDMDFCSLVGAVIVEAEIDDKWGKYFYKPSLNTLSSFHTPEELLSKKRLAWPSDVHECYSREYTTGDSDFDEAAVDAELLECDNMRKAYVLKDGVWLKCFLLPQGEGMTVVMLSATKTCTADSNYSREEGHEGYWALRASLKNPSPATARELDYLIRKEGNLI